jgi:hypothetical protein
MQNKTNEDEKLVRGHEKNKQNRKKLHEKGKKIWVVQHRWKRM